MKGFFKGKIKKRIRCDNTPVGQEDRSSSDNTTY